MIQKQYLENRMLPYCQAQHIDFALEHKTLNEVLNLLALHMEQYMHQ
jgi:hypothetical protein